MRARRAPAVGESVRAPSRILAQLASALLTRGVAAKAFGDMARLALVVEAAKSATFRNGRINYSRVAARTGLPRRVVRRLLLFEIDSRLAAYETPLYKVKSGWLTDRRYLDRRGRPVPLKMTGANPSFASLVREYGGNLPYRAVFEELKHLGVVTRDADGLCSLRHKAGKSPKRAQRSGVRVEPRQSPRAPRRGGR
jgi:hypothetical protein